MSYRIWGYKEDGSCYQIFGNNEYPEEFIKELEKQGCEIDEDGCFSRFEVKEVQPLIDAMNLYMISQEKCNKKHNLNSIFDLSKNFNIEDDNNFPLYADIELLIDCGYMFVVHNFLQFFKDELYKVGLYNYKIKDNCKIMISGG